jgi:hypothetical protein
LCAFSIEGLANRVKTGLKPDEFQRMQKGFVTLRNNLVRSVEEQE